MFPSSLHIFVVVVVVVDLVKADILNVNTLFRFVQYTIATTEQPETKKAHSKSQNIYYDIMVMCRYMPCIWWYITLKHTFNACIGSDAQILPLLLLLMKIADLTQTGIKYTSIWFIHGKKPFLLIHGYIASVSIEKIQYFFITPFLYVCIRRSTQKN